MLCCLAVKILWSNDLCLTSSIVLRSGRLSEIISQLQELLKGVEEVEISSFKYDSSLLAAQVYRILHLYSAVNKNTILIEKKEAIFHFSYEEVGFCA